MPLPTPTFDDLLRAYLAEYRTRLGDVDTSPGSDLYARAWGLAQFEANAVTKARWLLRQLSPETCEEEFLFRHMRLHGLTRLAPTAGAGLARVFGASGTTIPAGLQWTDPTGGLYTNDGAGFIGVGLGEGLVTVRALATGTATNLATGTVLALTAPVTGLDGTGVVSSGFTGGSGEETLVALRLRVADVMKDPPASGNDAHHVKWIRAVDGVRRGFVWPAYNGAGTVRTTFQGVWTGGLGGRVSPTLLAAVEASTRAQVANVARVNLEVVVPSTQLVDVDLQVQPRPGYEFDWVGVLAATVLTATTFTVAALPAGLAVGHRVTWAPAGGVDQVQRIVRITNIDGVGPFTITVAAPLDVFFTGAQTLYPGGRLNDPGDPAHAAHGTTAVQTTLLKEGGIFDRLTPGDIPGAGPFSARYPAVSPDAPVTLYASQLIAEVQGIAGVNSVTLVAPAASVTPVAFAVVVPRRVLVRPM